MSKNAHIAGFSVSILTLLALAPLAPLASAAGDENPNIVLVLMDNFGWGEVGVYGGGVMRGAPTPNIDSIAEEGLQLLNYNVEAECVPSRASLMTGRYGIRTRQRPDGPPRGVWYGITRWEHTLAEVLSDAGYSTAIFGKWHLGDKEGRYPTDQGFDEWIGIPRSSDRAFWPDSNSFTPGSHPDAVFTHVMSAKRGEVPKKGDVYGREKRKTIDREITDQSLDFIKRKADEEQPFFVFLSYTQTHEPVDPHPDYYGKTGNGSFADVLAQTDDYVGELLKAVDELGLKDDTIFIFTSDNGREGVPRSFGFTGPWRAGMFSPYEGSSRVPFLIRWPGRIPAARESVVIYLGNVLFGVKWRNWKLLLKEMDEDSYAIREMAYPSIYNLLVDLKEEVPELNFLNDTWVDFPLYKVKEDHEESIAKDPGAPGPW